MTTENKKYNQKCGERLFNVLKAKKKTQKEFAEAVHFTQQYINDICRGRKPLSHKNAEIFAEALDIRPEYLLCKDDFMTVSDKKKLALEEIGKFAMDNAAQRRIERLSRIAELSDVFQKLKEVYGVPDDWSDRSLADGFAFIAYLDEQIEHAFSTYFKYIDPANIPEEQSEKIDNVMDGVFEIMSDCLQGIKDEFPSDMTDGQFFDLLEDQENQDKVSNIIEKKILSITKK